MMNRVILVVVCLEMVENELDSMVKCIIMFEKVNMGKKYVF